MPHRDSSEEPIRVGFCITGLETGGAERCLTELVTRLDPNRYTPTVYVLGPRPLAPRDALWNRLEAAGVEMLCFDALGIRDTWSVLRRLTRQLKTDRPRLLQTFLFHGNILGRLAARRAGIEPVVSGIRVAERRGRWYLWLDRWSESSVKAHVCVSEAVADFARNQGRLPPEKLVVIPNGIDPGRLRDVRPLELSTLGLATGRRAILFVGRLDPQKGLTDLLTAAPRFLDRLPKHDLVLVGDGPLSHALRLQASALGIGDRVHFGGWRDDVPSVMAASDLFVLPSHWEGMPNALLEAMGSALPVVATSVEGVSQLLGRDRGPQYVPPGDVEQFSEAVVQILEDPHLAARLGEQNRQRAIDQFSLDAMVARYETLYEALLSGSGIPPLDVDR